MKKILFVNGSYNEIPLIKAAHELGLYVITSGNDANGAGHKYAGQYIPCDYSNKEEIYRIAAQEKVDAICSCGNDLGAISASYACEKLGLPGHDTFQNTRFFHEKDQFKLLCEKLHLSTPKSFAFSEVDSAVKFLSDATYPLMIKPSDLGGGKGITVVYTYDEAVVAVENAYRLSKIKKILIEEYINGTQHGFTCFIKDKKVSFAYMTDDFSYLNPYMVWVAIPRDDRDVCRKITDDVEKMAEELNMADGMLTIQYLLKDGVPYYIETMRRCLGNMHYKCLSWDYGVDIYKLFVANEAGLDTDEYLNQIGNKKSISAFMGIYADRNGTFVDYSIADQWNAYLKGTLMLEKPGYVIENYLSDKLGMLYFSFSEDLYKQFVKEMRDIVHVTVQE